MNLSSFTFLFIFLPFVILIYNILDDKYKNIVLLISSIIFYILIDIKSFPLIVYTLLINYIYPIVISKTDFNNKIKLILLYFIIIFDIYNLIFYKFETLPIGFSYIIFNYISYHIDIYKNKCNIEYDFIKFSLYSLFFGKILQGPIVRYGEISESLIPRKVNTTHAGEGINYIIRGLAIKSLLCINLTHMLDYIYMGEYSYISIWLHEIFYLVNLYLDFQSYMLLAKGVGLLFNINLPDNFNFPFISESISDFWRRWHITLSTWFRDYVYIPLGGSKRGAFINIISLFVVWVLTGIWHGFTYNFIIWGLLNLIFIIIDKYIYKKIFKKYYFINKLITFIIMVLIFISFQYTDINNMIDIYKYIFLIQKVNFVNPHLLGIVSQYGVCMILSIFVSLPICKKLLDKLNDASIIGSIIVNFLLIIISISFLISESYSGFLYTGF